MLSEETRKTQGPERPWGRIHENILKNPDLTERALRVYIALRSFEGRRNTFKVRQKIILQRAGLDSIAAVSIGLKVLISLGQVKVNKLKGGCNVYSLTKQDDYWGKIPVDILSISGISFQMLKVLCALSIRLGANENCFPSRRTISKMCNVSKSNVSKSIRQLEDIGLITVERDGRWTDDDAETLGNNFLANKKKNNTYWIKI